MLTGNTRYRKTLFGKMVLQVQERLSHAARRRAKLRMTTGSVYLWRDAKEEDLKELNLTNYQSESEVFEIRPLHERKLHVVK